MSEKVRNDIDSTKKFLQENALKKDFKENQKTLRSYIKVLKDNYKSIAKPGDNGLNYNKEDFYIDWFTIIHNFLYLENKYFDSFKLANKEINKYLTLPDLDSVDDIISKFKELYDPHNKVRYGIETADSIEEVRIALNDMPTDFYHKVYLKF